MHTRQALIWTVALTASLLVTHTACTAEQPTTQPIDAAPAPVEPAANTDDATGTPEAPVEPPAQVVVEEPAADSPVIRVLDQIMLHEKQVRSLRVKLRYDRIQTLVGDVQRRFGTLIYESGPPAKFSIHLDRLIVDGEKLIRQDRWFIFDGMWLLERLDDQKRFTRRQVVAPPREGEQAQPIDPLRMGSGPFLLPLNLDKQQVLRRFEVTLVPEDELDDLENSVHLHLTPRPEFESPFLEVDLWYHNQTFVPLRARTIDDSGNESIIDLTDHELNFKVDAKVFDTSPPSERGWEGEVRPFEP